MDRPLTKMTRMVIMIDTIDLARKTVHGIDKTGGKFQASYVVTAAGFQIPQPGENWTIIRHGNIWHLESRFDGPDETTKFDLSPGDVHLRVPGALYTNASFIQTDGGVITATTRDNFTGNGSATAFTLNGVPSNPYSVMVWKNGVFMHPDSDWTLSGNIVTFAAAPANGNKITVHYQRLGAENVDISTAVSVADENSSVDIKTPIVSVDSVVGGSGAHTWSHTVSGTNCYLIVKLAIASPSVGATGVTYNSVAMTLLGRAASSGEATEIWGLAGPATGAHNVVVSIVPGIAGDSVSLNNVDQGGAVMAAVSSNNTSSTATSGSITGNVGDMLVDGVTTGTTVTVSGANHIQRANDGGGDATGTLGATGVAQTTTWTLGGSTTWAMVVANIRQSTS